MNEDTIMIVMYTKKHIYSSFYLIWAQKSIYQIIDYHLKKTNIIFPTNLS